MLWWFMICQMAPGRLFSSKIYCLRERDCYTGHILTALSRNFLLLVKFLPWNELSEFYSCEKYQVPSHDGVMIPLTIVYSRSHKKEDGNPGLLYGLEAYGEILDKRWRSEPKSLLDRGWIIAFADVRGGGGRGRSWRDDGRWTKKQNSIEDYVSSARFLIDKGIIQENKLAGWGYSAGGLLLASAINKCPDLFCAAVLKVPFLDPTDTLLYPILPLIAADYDEFGYPEDVDDFIAIQEYSPYDNIPNDVSFPAVLVTSSFNTLLAISSFDAIVFSASHFFLLSLVYSKLFMRW